MTLGPRVFGKEAESAAELFLRKKGYRILHRNVRFPNGELDLVASIGKIVVFVEVKARRTSLFGGAPHAVNRRKELRLIQLAAQYLARYGLDDRPCRFDVVLCQGDAAESAHIEHIENAFEVPGSDLRW